MGSRTSKKPIVKKKIAKKPAKVRVQYYKDKKGEHRWRAKARNNRIIATGGEGYKTKAKLFHALHMIFNQIEYVPFEEVEK